MLIKLGVGVEWRQCQKDNEWQYSYFLVLLLDLLKLDLVVPNLKIWNRLQSQSFKPQAQVFKVFNRMCLKIEMK